MGIFIRHEFALYLPFPPCPANPIRAASRRNSPRRTGVRVRVPDVGGRPGAARPSHRLSLSLHYEKSGSAAAIRRPVRPTSESDADRIIATVAVTSCAPHHHQPFVSFVVREIPAVDSARFLVLGVVDTVFCVCALTFRFGSGDRSVSSFHKAADQQVQGARWVRFAWSQQPIFCFRIFILLVMWSILLFRIFKLRCADRWSVDYVNSFCAAAAVLCCSILFIYFNFNITSAKVKINQNK